MKLKTLLPTWLAIPIKDMVSPLPMVLILFYAVPLLVWGLGSLRQPADILHALIDSPILNAHRLSASVALVSLILGTPVSLLLLFESNKLIRRALVVLTFGPLVIGMVARNYGWIGLLNCNSTIATLGFNKINSGEGLGPWSICILVMAVIFLPWTVFILSTELSSVTSLRVRAAMSLGASWSAIWRKLIFWYWYRGALSAAFLTYMSSMGYFLTPAMLSGNTIRMPGNVILQHLEKTRDYGSINASVVSFAIHCTLTAIVFYLLGLKGITVVRDSSDPLYVSRELAGSKLVVNCLRMCSLPGLYLSVVPVYYCWVWGFFGTETLGVLRAFSAVNFYRLFEWDVSASLLITGLMAFVATLLGHFLVLHNLAKQRISDIDPSRMHAIVCLAPLVIPQIIYAVALYRLIGANRQLQFIVETLAMTILTLPVQYIILRNAMATIPVSRIRASLSLGAGPFESLVRAVVPSIPFGVCSAFACAFFLAADEVVVASLLWEDRPQPIAKTLLEERISSASPLPAVITVLVTSIVLAGYGVYVRFLSFTNLAEPS